VRTSLYRATSYVHEHFTTIKDEDVCMRSHGSRAGQQFSVLGRMVLYSLSLGQKAKCQGIQLDRPIKSLGVTCSEPRIYRSAMPRDTV
jgi:hypothetical protein